jgi:protein TonB
MRVQRPRHRHEVIGPLAAALLLHGFGLALAASLGFHVAVQAEEAFDTFALSLRPTLVEGVGEDGDRTEVAAGALEELDASEESEESEESEVEDAQPELLAQEFLPERLLPEASLLAAEEPVEFEPAPAEPSVPDAPSPVAEATDSPAPLTESGAPALGVGAQAEGVPLALRPRRAATWSSVLGDVREKDALAAVGPRPGKARAAAAGAPRTLVVREPKPLETPRPSYPGLSRRAGEEGSVVCRLHIDATGDVTEVEVVESSGFERLDESARTTLLSWRFEPQHQEGRNVAATLLHRVTFRLES